MMIHVHQFARGVPIEEPDPVTDRVTATTRADSRANFERGDLSPYVGIRNVLNRGACLPYAASVLVVGSARRSWL